MSDRPPDPSIVYGLVLDAAGVVTGSCQSNIAQPGTVSVTAEVYAAAQGRIGLCRYADGVLTSHAPVPAIALSPTITGNQWAFALGSLGLSAAWRAGTARSKDKDQIRIGLIARDTPLAATDPLLIRVAANAGTDASGVALIDVPVVFAKALTEST